MLFCGVSAASEKWLAITWDNNAEFMASFDVLCADSGLTSFDILEANGYPGSGKRLPVEGTSLLIPKSKDDLFVTWMEIQERNGGPRPLITVKLHGVPASMRGAPQAAAALPAEPAKSAQPQNAPPEAQPLGTPPDPAPMPESLPTPSIEPDEAGHIEQSNKSNQSKQSNQSNQKLAAIFDPALASRDIIISNPPVLKPMIGPPPVTQGKMIWPVSGKVSSGFGRRGRRNHDGVDMPMPNGTPIAAALGGVVADTGTNSDRSYRGYGNTVVIDHGNGISTLYAHCSKINVKKGQTIRQGEIVGFVGNTGRTTTHHVHFEVRKNGTAVNPIPYLVPR